MLAAEEARPEHRVGPAAQDRLEQHREILRVVFQVGVLDHDHLTRGVLDARPQRRALPPVDRMVHDDLHQALGLEPVEDLGAAVPASSR